MSEQRVQKDGVKTRMGSITNIRVYEYEDAEGNIYWSFAKPPTTIPRFVQMRAHTRIGTHLINFLVSLRHLAGTWGKTDGQG